MKRLFAVSSAALLLASSALAQTQNAAGPTPPANALPPPAPLGGCVYLGTSPGTLTPSLSGYGLQCGANGALNVNVVTGGGGGGGGGGGTVTQGTTPWVDNISQWAGTSLGAPTNYGTAPTGVVPGVNAFVTNFPSTQPVSGTVTAQQPASTTYAVSWSGQTVAATQSGPWSVSVSNFPTTQTIAGTVTANQGAPVAIGSAWPTYLTQGGAALSSSNALPAQIYGALPTGTNSLGTVGLNAGTNAIGSITNTSFAATQSGTWTVGLNAGSAVVGKFDIDQTTPGTTNGVQVNASALPAGAATATNQTNVQTAPGTAASTVLNVQGNPSGVPLPTNQTQMAGAALGAPTAYGTAPTGNVAGVNANVTASALPSGAATAANQTTGNGSLGTIATNTTGVATAANQTNVQSAAGTSAGTATTVQGNASGVPVPVSSSTLATAANQSTQIASEATIAQRAITYTDTVSSAVAASGTYTGTIRDLGAAPSYSRISAGVYSGVNNVTLNIQGCIDSACGNYIVLSSIPVSAASTATATATFLTRYYRVTVVNGSSSSSTTIQLVTSFTAN